MTALLSAALITAAAAQTTLPPPVVVATPPSFPVPRAPAFGEWLMHWAMSPVLCRDGGAQAPVRASEPRRAMLSYNAARASVTIDFRIDPDGRPLSIVRRGTGYVPDGEDVVPALAASRFAAGTERRGCVVTFTPDVTPLAAAPMHEVLATFMTPGMAPQRAIWDRIHAGGDCGDPAPAPLLRAFPDFKALPDQPGYVAWTVIGFDLSSRGTPRNVRTLDGSGMPALDAAGRKAVARSRFEKGRRTGCTFSYYKSATRLAAPPPPEEDAWRPAAVTCPRDHVWDREPRLDYPQPYNARSIEGWAMVTFDVAPWGEIGNVHAQLAEPSAEFGAAAESMLRAASFRPGPGYVGCVERVRYAISRPASPHPVATRPAPPPF